MIRLLATLMLAGITVSVWWFAVAIWAAANADHCSSVIRLDLLRDLFRKMRSL